MVERVGLGGGRRHHLEAAAVRAHLGLAAWQGLLGVAVVAPDARQRRRRGSSRERLSERRPRAGDHVAQLFARERQVQRLRRGARRRLRRAGGLRDRPGLQQRRPDRRRIDERVRHRAQARRTRRRQDSRHGSRRRRRRQPDRRLDGRVRGRLLVARVRSQHRADQHGVRQQGQGEHRPASHASVGPPSLHPCSRPFSSTMDADLAVEFRRAPAECAT